MRTWGRVPINQTISQSSAIGSFTIGVSPIGDTFNNTYPYRWVEVTTDANGFNDAVWLTTLCQTLQLGLGESPMFGNWGIPAQQSILTQVIPDYYVSLTQQLFAPYFLSLLVERVSDSPTVEYVINVTANPGAILLNPVPY